MWWVHLSGILLSYWESIFIWDNSLNFARLYFLCLFVSLVLRVTGVAPRRIISGCFSPFKSIAVYRLIVFLACYNMVMKEYYEGKNRHFFIKFINTILVTETRTPVTVQLYLNIYIHFYKITNNLRTFRSLTEGQQIHHSVGYLSFYFGNSFSMKNISHYISHTKN